MDIPIFRSNCDNMANHLSSISIEEAFFRYQSLKLAQERQKSRGHNDFDLTRELLRSFDIEFISVVDLPPNLKVTGLL